MVININKIFSGYHLCQLFKNNWQFRDHHSSDDGDRDGPWNLSDFLINWRGWWPKKILLTLS
jgi:hypothetical protein